MDRKIITHPGKPHRDELLAVAVALASDPSINLVERRWPRDYELDDPNVYLIDTGHRHETALLNFDHHQFPRGEEPKCALSLLLEHIGVYKAARKMLPWLKFSEVLDVHGPHVAASKVGLKGGLSSLLKLQSPIEIMILREFGNIRKLKRRDILGRRTFLFDLLKRLGTSVLSGLKAVTERHRLLGKKGQILQFKVRGHKVAWVPQIDGSDEPSLGLEAYLDSHGMKDIAITITADEGGDGWCLYRRNNHPGINFTQLEDDKHTEFTHSGGFLAKLTSKVDQPTLVHLLTKAAA